MILPTKQAQKTDIEFLDIIEEPIDRNEDKDVYHCILCNTFYTPCDQLVTIHESCFKKLLEQLKRASEEIQEMEIRNKELQRNAWKCQLKEDVQSHQIVGIQTELPTSHSDSYASGLVWFGCVDAYQRKESGYPSRDFASRPRGVEPPSTR